MQKPKTFFRLKPRGDVNRYGAFAIKYEELYRWDPPSYYKIDWQWPANVLHPIGSFLNPKKKKVDRKKFNFADLQPITIHFDGSIEKREIDVGREYKMDLFFADQGDFVVAKIDLKNGAVGIVPDNLKNVVVTSHFAVYTPNLKIVIPDYFHILIQTNFFKRYLWQNKVGAEGRKEVKLDFFESIKIPIPLLKTQRAIVKHWQKAKNNIEKSKSNVNVHEEELLNHVLDDCGIEISLPSLRPKSYSVSFNDIERWGVAFNRHRWNPDNLIRSKKYKSSPLSESAWINPSFHQKTEREDEVSFVPMEAVSGTSGEIVSSISRKYSEVCKGYTRFQEEDVIWAKITPCMQNGKSAVAKNLRNKIGFGSTEFHVIRSKNSQILIPDFIWILLRLKSIRVAAQRYFIGSAGQQRVPADFLSDLHIPIPPLSEQKKLITKVKKIK